MDVCKQAGLSTRQFYEEYDTLEDLLADLHLYVNDLVEQHVVEVVPQVDDRPPLERAMGLFRTYIDAVTRDPRHTRISFVEIVGVSPRLDQQRLERRARWITLIGDLLADGAARGDIEPRDFRLTAAALVGSINGLMHDWAVGWVDATIDEVTAELLRMLLGGLQISPDDATFGLGPQSSA
ncbi:TetR/AcrR family transcriptional regulator [Nocardia stercoris]|uniref:TetR/AcrR family transcriptional regulator n=1 Tax=Nocardia stercoris TaxID=2483361 RepID=UPI0018F3FED0|nr:TetR family transcriptional regulator C-terminal domain-containing protein [Nocardia stercoris]